MPRSIFLFCTVLMAACSDAGPAGPTATRTAAMVRITPDIAAIELGDSIALDLEVRDSTGMMLQGRPATWRSSAPDVVEVSQAGKAYGRRAGAATITAIVDGATDSAVVTVHPWNLSDRLLVIDSTMLRLASDSADRAAGVLRFTITRGAPAAPAVGTVLVGAQGGGFLRRVVSSTLNGSDLVVQTTSAALAEVVEAGGFSTSIGLLFDPGSGAGVLGGPSAAVSQVIWGEGHFHGMPEGMRAVAGGFDLSGLDVCKLLEEASQGAATCPSQLKKLEITEGRLDFEPDLELEAEFEGFSLDHFRGVAKGDLDLELLLAVEASGTLGELKKDVTFFTFTRPFYAQIGPVPVVGYAELELTGNVTVKATAKAAFMAGYTAGSSVELGAEYDGSSWKEVSENDGTFDLRVPQLGDSVLDAAMELSARVSMKPRLKIIFYGVVGPFAQVEPFGSATLNLSLSQCSIEGKSGIDAAIGFTVPFLDDDVADFDKQWTPLVTGPGSNWDCPLGTIDVTTITNGEDPDTDGYQVRLDGKQKGIIASNSQLSVPMVQSGSRTVALDGVASNCTVQGGAAKTVTVSTGMTHGVDFVIQCAAIVGSVDVNVHTTGSAIDEDGYEVRLDGGTPRPLSVNGSATFAGVPVGQRVVELLDVAPNCTVDESNPLTVTVAPDTSVAVQFNVQCQESRLVVRTQTTGQPSSDDGWIVLLDGVSVPIGRNDEVSWVTSPENHTVELRGLPGNCTISGANPRVVMVPAGSTAEEHFQVGCESGSLTVTVTTDTGDQSINSFTVLAGGQSFSVSANGSTTIELPTGPQSVQLVAGAGCTVDGQNPRQVSVPGTVSFSVTCQQVQVCTDDAPETSLLQEIGTDSDYQGSFQTDVLSATWGHAAGRVSTSSSSECCGPGVTMELGWSDYIQVVPIDPSQMGGWITILVEMSGSITIEGSAAQSRVHTYYETGDPSCLQVCDPPYDGMVDDRRYSEDGNGTFTRSQIVRFSGRFGEWIDFGAYLVVNTGADSESSTSVSEASLRVERIVGVVDSNSFQPLPVRELCTASGHSYPE